MPTTAVFGAGGKTGKEVVKLLQEQGHTVKAVVRSPGKHAHAFGAGGGSLQVVAGDVTDAASLHAALRGCDGGVVFAASGATFFSAKSVDYQGVVNTIEAAKAVGGVGRVVLVSSCLTTPKNRLHPLRILLNNVRWGLMDAKFKGEEALRASGLPYTVVRPGGLTDKPAGEAQLLALQGDRASGMVTRGDVAAVCVAALSDLAAEQVTFELVSDAKAAAAAPPLPEQLRGLFAGLQRDA